MSVYWHEFTVKQEHRTLIDFSVNVFMQLSLHIKCTLVNIAITDFLKNIRFLFSITFHWLSISVDNQLYIYSINTLFMLVRNYLEGPYGQNIYILSMRPLCSFSNISIGTC